MRKPAKVAKVAKVAKPAKVSSGGKKKLIVAREKNPVALSLPLGAVGPEILDRLWTTVLARRGSDPAQSHSARLLSRGTVKVAQKFGEEAVECLIEAVANNPGAVVAESADVLYHLVVLWVAAGVEPSEVWSELHRREGMSGIAEKASRTLNTKKIP